MGSEARALFTFWSYGMSILPGFDSGRRFAQAGRLLWLLGAVALVADRPVAAQGDLQFQGFSSGPNGGAVFAPSSPTAPGDYGPFAPSAGSYGVGSYSPSGVVNDGTSCYANRHLGFSSYGPGFGGGLTIGSGFYGSQPFFPVQYGAGFSGVGLSSGFGYTGGYGAIYRHGFTSGYPYPYYGGYGFGGVGVYPGFGYSVLGPTAIGPGGAFHYPQGFNWRTGALGAPFAGSSVVGLGNDPRQNPVLADEFERNVLRWSDQLPPLTVERDVVQRAIRLSSAEAKARSLNAQSLGDEAFRRQSWLAAAQHYKRAMTYADDRGEAHLRLAITYAAMNKQDLAVASMKRAVYVDPTLVSSGFRLSDLFAPGADLARGAMLNKAIDWTQQDVRDPDRLFLMGALLHFEGDARSREIIESAYRLAGKGDHLVAFLQPAVGAGVGAQVAVQPANVPQPPAPALGGNAGGVAGLPQPPAPGLPGRFGPVPPAGGQIPALKGTVQPLPGAIPPVTNEDPAGVPPAPPAERAGEPLLPLPPAGPGLPPQLIPPGNDSGTPPVPGAAPPQERDSGEVTIPKRPTSRRIEIERRKLPAV